MKSIEVRSEFDKGASFETLGYHLLLEGLFGSWVASEGIPGEPATDQKNRGRKAA